ncbi:MAG: hypothetical protein KW788_04185 [Candidatus Doudnabacteria bacterium]|nr:hypothetical protein [Candidatus Doudnabacteria bacterium]
METTDSSAEHGALYWFFYNKGASFTGYYRRHWFSASLILFVIAFLLFGLRAFYHPYVMIVRQKSFLLALALLLVVTWFEARGRRTLMKFIRYVLCLAGLVALYFWGGGVHDYLSQYYRYKTLNIVELDKLPITGHERLQPLNSIYSLAHEKVATEMESPQRPDFVAIGNEYKWTVAIEPSHLITRFGKVKELVSVNDSAPDFTNREKVNFEVGENMLLGKSSHAATVKTFGLWRFLNYEPGEVKYIKDDSGQWVQVVSLIRWSGLLFPRPEFGGVQLIRQQEATWLGDLRLMLFGTGQWIRPEEISQYKFLVGQNNLPYNVSRYIARSFRFQNGFFGPMPGNQQGDVRIPDLPADVNEQPFTTYFEQIANRPGTLYHYFALEPSDPRKQGLSISLFIPADGIGSEVYAYRHNLHGEALTGVSAIASKVKDSQLMIDWRTHGPVEHRPFIRDIDGKRRFFWLTSVVTFKEETAKPKTKEPTTQPSWFIAGSAGNNIVITDAATNIPVWVTGGPNEWTDEIKTNLAKRSQGK